MAVIDRVSWAGAPDVLAWRYPSDELSTWTQLIVNESQDAYVVKGGVYEGPFEAGRHTLSTENIPILRSLIGLPFGKKSPFSAEVWFVNKVTNLNVLWGTSDPIQLQDPVYKLMVPVRAFGQYGVQIINSKRFLLKFVGTLTRFDINALSEYLRGAFITRIKTNIAAAIITEGVSILEVSTRLESLSETLKRLLSTEMAEYGIGIVQFNINSINVPEDDPAIKTLKGALAKRAEMGIVGYNYQQERSFDVMQTAAGNEGTAGTMIGTGLGLGIGAGIGVPMGNAFAQVAPRIDPMSHVVDGSMAAGSVPLTCPTCKAMNQAGAKFCTSCGGSLAKVSNSASTSCPKCMAAVSKDSKFCPECGAMMAIACAKCGTEMASSASFCGNCGEPRQKD
jgi:membrane protease subunit (stomatin/prohibitin family)